MLIVSVMFSPRDRRRGEFSPSDTCKRIGVTSIPCSDNLFCTAQVNNGSRVGARPPFLPLKGEAATSVHSPIIDGDEPVGYDVAELDG